MFWAPGRHSRHRSAVTWLSCSDQKNFIFLRIKSRREKRLSRWSTTSVAGQSETGGVTGDRREEKWKKFNQISVTFKYKKRANRSYLENIYIFRYGHTILVGVSLKLPFQRRGLETTHAPQIYFHKRTLCVFQQKMFLFLPLTNIFPLENVNSRPVRFPLET